MLLQWMPSGALVAASIGGIGYLVKRRVERRRDTEVFASLIQAADLCTKLRQSGVTLNDLRALQDEVLKRGL